MHLVNMVINVFVFSGGSMHESKIMCSHDKKLLDFVSMPNVEAPQVPSDALVLAKQVMTRGHPYGQGVSTMTPTLRER